MGYGAGVLLLLVRRSRLDTWSEASLVYAADHHHERQDDGDEREMARRGTVPDGARQRRERARPPTARVSGASSRSAERDRLTLADPRSDPGSFVPSAIRCLGDAASADVDSIPSPILRTRGNHVL
jgi:hypothetical protein